MVCAHRGDINIFYPENSFEGFLSAIEAGADILEMDLHTTADGEIILMHDDTLTRTTNVTALRRSGETWMPQGDEICRWTLPQLRQLRLVTANGTETEYAIPTLREVLSIAKDRVFVTLDKTDCFHWEDVYRIIEELGCYRTVLIPYNYDYNRVLEIRNQMYRDHGVYPPYFSGVVVGNGIWNEEKIRAAIAFLQENNMAPVLRGGYHNLEDVAALKPLMSEITKTHRIYAESMGEHRDKPEVWDSMLDMGYSIFMGNRLYDLLRLVKVRHFCKK